MSQRSVPSTHRIGVLTLPAGRYLECRDCLLRFNFPTGAQYDVIAKQFQSHLCPFPTSQDIDSSAGDEQRRYLVMLRYERRVPVMASCAKCERRFFVPNTFSRDAVADYLRQRFDMHRCEEQEK